MAPGSFFVPDPDLIVRDREAPYSLYINSSILEDREHYVRIFKQGEFLSSAELQSIRDKYNQIYMSENERAIYLKSACQHFGKKEEEQVVILKNSALHHLTQIFAVKTGDVSVDIINQTLEGCRQTVEGFVELVKNYDLNQLHELIGSLSFHDFYTYDHSINVSMYNILLYRLMRPDAYEADIVNAGMCGFLHDIGKIKIPNRILNKVGKLTDEEFKQIQLHTIYGKDYLSKDGVKAPPGAKLDLIREVVFQHHENYDGTGYPNKLRGEEIHFLARMTAVADFFDAITTKRSYSEALTIEEALDLMGRSRGKKLDPFVFDRFVSHMKEKYQIKACAADISADLDPCQPHMKFKRSG